MQLSRPVLALASLSLMGVLAASLPVRAQTATPEYPAAKRRHMMAPMHHGRGPARVGDAQNGEVDQLNTQSLQRAQQGQDAGMAGSAMPASAPSAAPMMPAK